MVDLTVCKPGDYLIARNGCLYVYKGPNSIHQLIYPHLITRFISRSKQEWIAHSVTDDGQIYREYTCDYDVIEIVPQTNSSTPYFELYEKLRLHKRASSVA